MSPVAVAVALVAAQRLGELALSRRNAEALLRRGATEHGRSHYPLIVMLHVAWLGALLWVVPADAWPNWWLAGIYVALQVVRAWAILSLGPYWTTRVITLPSAPLVTSGPYRFLRHPIYAVVAGEIALLPLAFGAWRLALVASAVNAAMLAWRIGSEERALSPRRGVSTSP
jgi:methyltransferase